MQRKNQNNKNQTTLFKNIIYLFAFFTALLLIQNFGCYKGHGISPPQGVSLIRGKITFTGTPPDSTKEVWIAVLKKYPSGIDDTNQLFLFVLSNLVISDSIPSNVPEYDYELEIKPGQYEWVLVVWFPDIEDYLFGAKELGAYYFNPDDPLPTPIDAPRNEILEGIDIIADFGNVNNEEPFYKKTQ